MEPAGTLVSLDKAVTPATQATAASLVTLGIQHIRGTRLIQAIAARSS